MTFEPVVLGDCTIYHGDCLQVMPELEAGSIDAIITDLPYQVTACEWDSIIPLEPMWMQVRRLLKSRGAFVTTASQPFTTILIASNLKWFKHCWVWDKVKPSGFQVAKFRPMMQHEDIAVFCKGIHSYNPQMIDRPSIKRSKPYSRSDSSPLKYNDDKVREYSQWYPKSILTFSNADQDKLHPTQKPLLLYEYLINTYTDEGQTVLDIAMGSGTTGEACVRTNRKFIGIEKERKYIDISVKRIQEAQMQLRLF